MGATSPATGTPPPTRPTPAGLVATSVVFLLPLSVLVRVWSPPTRNIFTATLVLPVDFGLAAAVVAGLPVLVRAVRRHRAPAGALGWAVTTATLVAAYPWNPSGRGLLTLVHLGGCAGLAAIVGASLLSDWRRPLAGAVCAVGVVETAWGGAQLALGRSLGLSVVGEMRDPFTSVAGAQAAAASFPHPYLLAAFSLVAAATAAWMALVPGEAHPRRWAVVAGVCIAPVGFTYSRSAALGLGLLGLCLLFELAVGGGGAGGRRAAVAAVVLALGLGAGVPAALGHRGWIVRAAQSNPTATISGEGRGSQVREATTFIEDHPWHGVGPGRFVFAVEQRYGLANAPTPQGYLAAHDLPLLAGAEGGVLALVAMTTALLWVGWRSLRAGPLAVGIYLVFLPFCLLDQLPYVSVQGAATCGLWLGLLDACAAGSHGPRPDRGTSARAGISVPESH